MWMVSVLLEVVPISICGHMWLDNKKISYVVMVVLIVLVILAVHNNLLQLLVITISVSLVTLVITIQTHSILMIDCMWDGDQCGVIERGCCAASGLPWFHKTLSSSTSDYIELRLCCDQGTSDEDVPVGLYEIYTK